MKPMCSQLFESISYAALVILYLSLCIFVYRIQKNFIPKSGRFCILALFLFVANGVFLGFHIESTCSRHFLTAGSLTFALFFIASLLEGCTYVFDITY